MSNCRECGAPMVVRAFAGWNSDGTITAKYSDGAIRIGQVDCEEIRNLVRGISSRIGFPIDRIVAEGERKANRSTVDTLLSRARGLTRHLLRNPIGAPLFVQIMTDVAVGLGHGLPEVIEHKRGRLVRVRVRDPYCAPMIAGDLWGTYEALFMMTAHATWEEEDDSVVITVEKIHDGMVWEDPLRLSLESAPTFPAELEIRRCSRCGVPLDTTSSFMWDVDHGTMIDRTSGRRVVNIIVEVLNAVIRELTWELGDEIQKMVRQIEQECVAGSLANTTIANTVHGYRALLEGIRIRGLGDPVDVLKEGEVLTVRINSPFCEPMLAGRVAGCYEAVEGVAAETTWTPDTKGYIVVQAWPA